MSSVPATTAIVIGAGFSGLAMCCQLKRTFDLDDYCIYDRQPQLGGTWSANTYPGCGVDIPGICYSLSFAPNPEFTCLFPRQKEILKYMNRVATEYGVHQHFKGRIEWISASWQEDTHQWLVTLQNQETGQRFCQECRILISAVGGITNPNSIAASGIEDFTGDLMHTARWDHRVDLTDKHVVVIGNGASAAQLIPAILGKPKTITQFMRSPHHLVPSQNYHIPAVCRLAFRYLPWLLYLARIAMFLYMETQFFAFLGTTWGAGRRREMTKVSRDHIRKNAPERYQRLLASNDEFGCKRRVFDQGYVSALHGDGITLSDDPVTKINSNSVSTKSGGEVLADVIILATGFALTQYDTHLQGRGDKTRELHWSEFKQKSAFKSIAMHGFPNFFYVLGPNSGRLHTSAVLSIENYVDLIISVITPVIHRTMSSVEVKSESEERYNKELLSALDQTVHSGSCASFLIDGMTQKNWFVYPWDSLRMWISTHWGSSHDWNYQAMLAFSGVTTEKQEGVKRRYVSRPPTLTMQTK